MSCTSCVLRVVSAVPLTYDSRMSFYGGKCDEQVARGYITECGVYYTYLKLLASWKASEVENDE